MNNPSIDWDALDRECVVFCRYLIDREPGDYVTAKYRDAHRTRALSRARVGATDMMLVKVARVSPVLTRMIDAYALVFHRTGLVRKKLVLLLAILECSADTHPHLQRPEGNSLAWIVLKSTARVLTFLCSVMMATCVLFPVEVVMRVAAKWHSGLRPATVTWTE